MFEPDSLDLVSWNTWLKDGIDMTQRYEIDEKKFQIQIEFQMENVLFKKGKIFSFALRYQ